MSVSCSHGPGWAVIWHRISMTTWMAHYRHSHTLSKSWMSITEPWFSVYSGCTTVTKINIPENISTSSMAVPSP